MTNRFFHGKSPSRIPSFAPKKVSPQYSHGISMVFPQKNPRLLDPETAQDPPGDADVLVPPGLEKWRQEDPTKAADLQWDRPGGHWLVHPSGSW